MKMIRIALTTVYLLLISISLFGQLPQLKCDLVDPSNPNHDSFFPICDLNVLDGYSAKMSNIITGNGPVPLCNNGGAPQNISWFSFIAPEGEYSLALIPSNCVDASGNTSGTGIQSGIYTDCSFIKQIGPCIGDPCSLGPIRISNKDSMTGEFILIPGETYYWFLDGCSGSVCEFTIEISGNAIPYNDVLDGELLFELIDLNDFSLYRARYFEELTDFGDFYWSISPSSFEVYDAIIDGERIKSNKEFLDFRLLEEVDYMICLDSIVSDCYSNNESICMELKNHPFIVSGRSYWDLNENDQLDENDIVLPNTQISTGNFTVFTNSRGEYSLPVNPGQVSLKGGVYKQRWDENPVQIDTSIDNINLINVNVPFNKRGSEVIDLRARFYPISPICNTNGPIEGSIFNTNSVSIAFSSYLEIDTFYKFLYSEPEVDSIVENRYYFSSVLAPFDVFSPKLFVEFPGEESLDEPIKYKIHAQELNTGFQDSSVVSTTYYCYYNSSNKSVIPNRLGKENWTLKNEVLEYTINFQNNGSDTASHVRIVDILDQNLDINSLVITGRSDSVTHEILEDTVFFDFDEIILPNSLSNSFRSKGFVRFTVYPKAGIANNTVINNTARIYIDSGPVFVTNTVSNTIVDALPCFANITVVDTSVCLVDMPLGIFGYTESGTYVDTFILNDGCDSIREMTLSTGGESFSLFLELNICAKDSILIGGEVFQDEGDYQVIGGENKFGCDSIIQFSIMHYPAVVTTLTDQYICQGDTINIAGTQISEIGNYTLSSGQTALGCDSILIVNVLLQHDTLCDPLSNVNSSSKPIVQIFPNPVKNQITYTLEKTQESAYSIYSLHGQLLLNGEGRSSQVEVDVTALRQGTYILKVMTSDGAIGVKKVVKL